MKIQSPRRFYTWGSTFVNSAVSWLYLFVSPVAENLFVVFHGWTSWREIDDMRISLFAFIYVEIIQSQLSGKQARKKITQWDDCMVLKHTYTKYLYMCINTCTDFCLPRHEPTNFCPSTFADKKASNGISNSSWGFANKQHQRGMKWSNLKIQTQDSKHELLFHSTMKQHKATFQKEPWCFKE